MERADDLLPKVYDQLKKAARRKMARERLGHTLQPTALVHEAYLRLVANGDPGWVNEAQFSFAAGEAMRRILIDHARRRGRRKRGGGRHRVPLQVVDLPTECETDEHLDLEELLERLGERDPELENVVRLRHLAGLNIETTAAILGVSPSTVKRDWTIAKAWLYREMTRV